MEGTTIIGGTPFEKAIAGRAKTQLLLVTHYAVKELVAELDECEAMIAKWKDVVAQYNKGEATKSDLEFNLKLATQALKDKKLFEEALVQVCLTAAEELGLEA